MKRKHFLPLLSLAMCAAASHVALAQSSGNITINGMITDTTCAVNITGPAVSGNVITMQNASVTDLAATGQTAKPENFTFDLTGCPATTTGVWAHFYGSNVNGAGRLSTTTGSANVSFELLDGAAPIVAGGTASMTGPTATQGTSVPDAPFSGGAASKTYTVRYYAEAGLTTPADLGAVSSLVMYNLHYL